MQEGWVSARSLWGCLLTFLDISDKNDVWAHIEACASVVTACLPTLGPLLGGTRTLGSIIESLRSMFSIMSDSKFAGNKSKTPEDRPSLTRVEDKRPWYELQSPGTNATATKSTVYDDVEAQCSNSILVKKTFISGHE